MTRRASRTDARSVPRRALDCVLAICLAGGATIAPAAAEFTQSAASPASRYLVDAGGNGYSDPAGRSWRADAPYSSTRGFGFVGGIPKESASPIAGTDDDRLYRTARVGDEFAYRFALPNGTYSVSLLMAEIAPNHYAVGSRVFSVRAESSTVLSRIDIYDEVGAETAVNKTFPVNVADGRLGIRFIGVTGRALVSAMKVVPTSSPAPIPTPSPSPNPSPTLTPSPSPNPSPTLTPSPSPTPSPTPTPSPSPNPSPTAAPDYALTVDPTSRTVAPGSSTTYTVEVEFLGGFSSTEVRFSLTGAPAGVTWSFTPNPITHEGRTVLEVRAASSTTPGTYPLQVIARANGLTRAVGVTLVVSTAPDFGLVLSPSIQSAARGSTATYDVTVSSQNGFSSSVALDATGLPSGVTDVFVPNPVSPPAMSQLRLQVGTSVPSGTYGFTVVGTSGTRSRSVNGTLIVQSAGNWTVSVIGSTGSANNSVVVGPARNDGIDRVYVGTVTTGRVWEFSWDGSTWVSSAIGGSGNIHNMAMGPGRDDGRIRIYACSHDRLIELTYVGPGWSSAAVGTVHGDCTHAVVGNGRNDGRNRVYATRGNGVYEYEWTGSAWQEVLVGTVTSGTTHGLALGPGRNDTTNRLYIASTQMGTFEATYSGGWVMRSMGDAGDVRNVSLGAGRNDGVTRVYAATRDGYIRELSWTGSGWTSMHINQPVRVMVHAYVVNGRNDGVMRVYGSAGDGGAYEYTFTGSGWAEQRLGGGSEYMYGFHYGRPRGMAIRLYGSDFGSDVYEYTWQ